MKKILVPVDFSHNSSDALRYAGEIANLSGAEIFALHVYQGDKPMKTQSIILEEKMIAFTNHALRNHPKIKFSVKYSFHTIADSKFLNGVLDSGLLADMDLVVMGTKGADGLKEVFIGSNTFDLAQKIDKPVIAVPRGTFFQGLKRIMFCSDFNNQHNLHILQPLKDLALLFNTDIRICHVRISGEKHPSTSHMDESVEEDNFFGTEVKHNFKIINSSSVMKGLSDYIQYKSDIEMVAVVNHKRSTLTTLYRTDHARKLAFHSKMPILILNENVASL